jgi:RHS repeat-associated protein
VRSWNGHTPSSSPDSANNLKADPVTGALYSWDSRNQLSSIAGGPAASFTGAYDSIMRRYDQTTAFGGGGTTTYLHDNKDVARSDTFPFSNNYLMMPGTGEVLAFSTTGGGHTNNFVPLQDRLGSTIGLVNSSNSLQTQYTYDPFGNATTTGQASSYPYLFGRMELDSSGLYHTQTRYYSPTFGRFLSADAGLTANAFTYAGNNPVNEIDPTGMSPEDICGADCLNAAGSDNAIQYENPTSDLGGLLGWLVDFFSSLFGGGGDSQPVIPPGYRRRAHYPPGEFIGAGLALLPAQENSDSEEDPIPGGWRVILVADGDQYTRGLNTGKHSPQYRNGTPKLPFGACVGMIGAVSLPTIAALGSYVVACATTWAACIPVAGAVGYIATIIEGCHEQSLGKPVPDLGEPPPGEAIQRGESEPGVP